MPRKPVKAARKTSPRSRRPAARVRRGGRFFTIAGLLLLALFAIYLGYLNYLINARFEGGAWALPSRVYARALELYPGATLTRDELVYELELSSYLRVDRQPLAGEYRLLGASLELHSPAFVFTDQPQAARLV